MTKGFCFIICAFLLGACQTQQRRVSHSEQGPNRAKEIAAWVQENDLVKANPREIELASRTEVPFVGQEAKSPNGRVRVVFKVGTLRTLDRDNKYGPLTTTSIYELTETNTGKVLAHIQSTLSDPMNQESRIRQKVWFLGDDTVLVNEEWCDGCAPHYLTALISLPQGKSFWAVKYLNLPCFFNSVEDEFHGPKPIGIWGDVLLFQPFIGAEIYKKTLRDLPEARPPLPFTMG